MKKVASILAVALFAVSMIASQTDKMDFDFDIETMLSCVDCDMDPPRGGNGNA